MKPIIEEAAEITSGSRQWSYGDAESNHGCAAKLKAAYRERRGDADLDGVDHCVEMMLTKIARFAHGRNRDDIVDVVGYAINVEAMMRERWEAAARAPAIAERVKAMGSIEPLKLPKKKHKFRFDGGSPQSPSGDTDQQPGEE